MHPASNPAPTEPPVIAFFDVDNTLMRGASAFHVGREAFRRGIVTWRDLATFAWQQLRFTRVGENNEHLASVRNRALSIIAGHTEAQVRDIAETIWERDLKPRLWPETVALAHEHMAQGHQVWLLSATPTEVCELIAQKLGLTGARGTDAEKIDGVYTGRLLTPAMHGEQKAVTARELADATGADLAASWAYSDSRNDIPLLELAGNRIAVNPDAALTRYAHERGWPTLTLDPASLKAEIKRVRRAAKSERRSTRKDPNPDA